MSVVLLTGGTGTIGQALTSALLEKGHEVIVVTRNPAKFKAAGNLSYAAWDLEKQVIDPAAIRRADYILHLAGAGVADKRWSTKRKKEIRDSRVQGGQLICKALRELPNHVEAVVSASAIGWYGPDPVVPNPHPFKEDQSAYDDFLGSTCKDWEDSLQDLTAMGKRLVILRTGIVLSPKGGALKEFMRPLKFGVAAILGSGSQVISWIHMADLVRLYLAGMENKAMHGVYNAVAPKPVNNKTLTLTLAKKMRGSLYIPVHVPAFVLKLMLGEMSIEVLKSATVSAEKCRQSGFQFTFPSIESALGSL